MVNALLEYLMLCELLSKNQPFFTFLEFHFIAFLFYTILKSEPFMMNDLGGVALDSWNSKNIDLCKKLKYRHLNN